MQKYKYLNVNWKSEYINIKIKLQSCKKGNIISIFSTDSSVGGIEGK